MHGQHTSRKGSAYCWRKALCTCDIAQLGMIMAGVEVAGMMASDTASGPLPHVEVHRSLTFIDRYDKHHTDFKCGQWSPSHGGHRKNWNHGEHGQVLPKTICLGRYAA